MAIDLKNILKIKLNRKIFAVGFVFVFLFGVFAPTVSLAQTPATQLGTCSKIDGDPNSASSKDMSQADCNNLKGTWTANPPSTTNNTTNTPGSSGSFITDFSLGLVIKFLTIPLTIILGLMAALLGLSGLILDYVIKLSIIDLAENIKNITGINIAWATIRDLANMSFIFILLYSGIYTIFSSDNKAKKIVVPVIIAALLINFSLYFTKLIIDASNVVTISFYNSLAQAGAGALTVAGHKFDLGFSGAFMRQLNLTSLFATDNIADSIAAAGANPGPYITTMVGGSLFMLVATFVFLAIGVLFLIRYLVFILLLVISPIGYMASVIPGLKSTADKYWHTLLGQAYFAPLFMIMSWITLTLTNGLLNTTINSNIQGPVLPGMPSPQVSLGAAFASPSASSIGIIVNFCLIIGMLILTIIVSKTQATKGGIVTNDMINKGTGLLGGAMFGGAAKFARGTIGARANTMANDDNLKERAKNSWFAKQQLNASKYVAGSSLDIRRSAVGEAIQKQTGTDFGKGSLFNEKAGKGGYAQTIKDKEKKEEDYAKSLKPSDAATEEAKKLRDATFKDPEFIAKEATEKTKYMASLEYAEKKKKYDKNIDDLQTKWAGTTNNNEREIIEKEMKKREAEYEAEADTWMSEEKKNLIKNAGGQEEKKNKDGIIKQQKVESLADERAEAYAKVIDKRAERATGVTGVGWKVWHGNPQLNKAAAAKVRALKKAKSGKDKAADAIKAIADEAKASGEEEAEAPAGTTPPAGGTTTPPAGGTPPPPTP